MPELPEVEHVKRGIAPHILNHKIKRVQFSEKVILGKSQGKDTIIKGITLEKFKLFTENYEVTQIERRSKYILIYLKDNHTTRIIISHLGMSGAYFVVEKLEDIPIYNYQKHWQVVFHLENNKMLVYSDIRRFGEIRNVQTLEDYPSILEIAPEPFDEKAMDHFMNQFHLKKYQNMSIKQMILDHKVIAGCGNIYACEALFDASIHPQTKAQNMTEEAKRRLFNSVIKVLYMGIENGGTSISDYVHADGERGTMQNNLKVYKQNICSVCGGMIKREIIAGRNTHYCPNCQL
ncbi:bifunctional DNA-formamidopyrimidine glycosylase/DNA-(apurinic or apyrimidinic site) lyase [Staphylococcus felis]|uniref:bifunctional DNA-formamidopyrimidine glycosylase/DNA-(apurinic or apyrimidinic site) lyase n=1 Tax=Staphylococcus felis TaxID=46127 RepID=UPI000CD103F9|nr:bifunctional DNA-formamidopyrimidine glycosylase/DNA-(apurinic or apyrimidinic site) lyase [Staphylococcus felis]AVP37279.1 bifunctional DNA-formamidopyrimidine glycosylase/DNA-(apurinic or apyrimidinic site) lyase [Staphylococcus felis]PNZ34858.1 DNA-formamidopyrimidine glycosylase [Staphylococcus felis]QQB02773.1 bifunctional DNA-formamidopyrimidine glycosylase/DNA-(apurinic or apyrimidinic site) lyase [Staphylococcus felis]REI03789.1 bifunctional DNA-formamidopyrimidine glycosylase/DNA-(a